MTHERIEQLHHDGLTFPVRDTGPVEGDPVVLLHGFPQRGSCWDAVVPVLHEAGLRTLAPDQRGYHPDCRPPGRGAYALDRLTGDVTALLDRLDRPVHLVGHDWGAVVAWALATASPERLASLTTVSVPHPGAFLRALPRGQALRSWYMAAFQLPRLPEWWLGDPARARRTLRHAGLTGAGLERTLADLAADPGLVTGGLGWYRALPASLGGSGGRARLRARVPVPTTHVWSDRDVALTRRGADLAGEYVDGPYTRHVLEGVSHWVPDETPRELGRIVVDRARQHPAGPTSPAG